MKQLRLSLLIFMFLLGQAAAADLSVLTRLFEDHYNSLYTPRFCGQNIARFIQLAKNKKMNLSHSYVLKIMGAGFFETSGFYTRGKTQERAMLGYFHMVLVADGRVFDFDLAEPLVLKLEDYVRLQFTPPYEPFHIWGKDFVARKELPWWKVTAFSTHEYAQGREEVLWSKKVGELVSLEEVLNNDRLR